jgi:UDPglucose--hexose-1-phosphate uridylyltransferase
MSQLRHDPIQRRWVIIAINRSERPRDLKTVAQFENGGPCPFCPGNERETPGEIIAWRHPGTQPNQPGWEVRVVPNRYPALQIEGELERCAHGIYDTVSGIGAHEAIVETPEHDLTMSDYSVDHLAKVITAYRERIQDLYRDHRFRYVLVFKNYGALAGASLKHSHSQLIATPVTPRLVSLELDSARDYYGMKERCLFCDIIKQEMHEEVRVVSRNEKFLAFCPFASRFPYETFIMPLKHSHDFTTLDEDGVRKLASLLKDVLFRLKVLHNDPPYNFVIHTSPNVETSPRRPGYWGTLPYDYHWHIEIIPRLQQIAGFEWGSGFYINGVEPEVAAERLRKALG